MKKPIYFILTLAVAAIIAVLLLKRRSPEQPEITITETEIPGEVTTNVPTPTIQIPAIDSSIFVQLEKYKRLWLSLQRDNANAEIHWRQTIAALGDSSLDLQSRYDILLAGCENQANRVVILRQYIEGLEKKLEETANGEYKTEGIDSTDVYRMEWSISSFGPLKNEGFKRTVNVTQKTVTNETSVIKYPSFEIGVLYGFQPNGTKIYSLQGSKNWKRIGVISQIGITNDKEQQFSIGLKLNFN